MTLLCPYRWGTTKTQIELTIRKTRYLARLRVFTIKRDKMPRPNSYFNASLHMTRLQWRTLIFYKITLSLK